MALENTKTPTALLLSRQSVNNLPARESSTRLKDAMEASRGAYIIQEDGGKPDIILVANGSEVSTLIEGAERLRTEKGLKIQVVSAPSEGLFRKQDKAYQDKVLPPGVPVFGLTAGLPVTLQGLAGTSGKVIGVDHFGYSAPYKVLDEKFGFTPDNIYNKVLEYLNK